MFVTGYGAVRAQKTARVPKGLASEMAEWVKPGRVRFLKGEEKLRHATLRKVVEE